MCWNQLPLHAQTAEQIWNCPFALLLILQQSPYLYEDYVQQHVKWSKWWFSPHGCFCRGDCCNWSSEACRQKDYVYVSIYLYINLNMIMINTSQLATLNDLITHCTDPLSSSPSSLIDVAEDLSDKQNSASTISGVRRRSELSDLPKRSNHHEPLNAVTNNQRRGVTEAGANLYLHSSLNLVSDAVGQILKSWRSLHRQQDGTEGVRPR